MNGVLELIDWHGPVLVVSEGWPSWSFALRNLGCSDIATLARFRQPRLREEFKSTTLGSTYVNSYNDLVSFCVSKIPPLVFLQGSSAFCASARTSLSGIRGALFTSLSLSSSALVASSVGAPSSSFCDLLSHVDCGGITDSLWFIQTDASLSSGFSLRDVSRTFGAICLNKISGPLVSSMDASEASRVDVVRAGDLVPFGCSTFLVEAPCIFNPNDGPVHRKVDGGELFDSYDMGGTEKTRIAAHARSVGIPLSYGFTSSAPVKVAMRLGRAVLNHIWDRGSNMPIQFGSTSLKRPSPPPSPSSFKRSKLEHLAPFVTSVPSLDNPIPSSLVEKNILLGSSRAFTGPDVKAAKNDDAGVDESSWDRWSVDSFTPTGSTSPLICIPGTYSVKHSTLFSGLRKIAHRWYRRRILHSLLSYLDLTHGYGEGRSEKESVKWKDCENNVVTTSFKVSRWVSKVCLLYQKTPNQRASLKGKSRELWKDFSVGSDAVERAVNSSWWNWDQGSTIFFWRWSKQFRVSVRDGTKLFIKWDKSGMPSYTKPQRLTKNPSARMKVTEKINAVRLRKYIKDGGYVTSTTGFFDVPKGEGDIRMVYDATKCGLNDVLWTPNFFLPTIDSILRNVDNDFWFGDIDLGEMFLNFWLDDALRPYAGVDVTELGRRVVNPTTGKEEFVHEGVIGQLWERWERTLMGLQSSPYVCTQSFGWCEDFIRGERGDPNNPLEWAKTVLNLPGSEDYDPTKPWVYRISKTGRLASFFGTYIDDIRTGGVSEKEAWRTSRRVASRVQYLGMQDAPRKRRAPSRTPGAWAGAMCKAKLDEGVFVTCSQEKWNKGKAILDEIFSEIENESSPYVDFKMLEKGCGFLVHLSRTFPGIFPYLRGIYNTMNAWRGGRDRDGWKYTKSELDMLQEMDGLMSEEGEVLWNDQELVKKTGEKEAPRTTPSGNPTRVVPVERLKGDINALMSLMEGQVPPDRLVRGSSIQVVRHGFGDASKAGFGSSWESNKGIRYRYGCWGSSHDESSSNLRELTNLVETLEIMSNEGDLDGVEMFLFTDNSTAEWAFYKGSSSSELLFNLILRLRKLEMQVRCKLNLIHVSGKRMIAQGSDGLSRGDFSEGVMKGDDMKKFIPLHLSAIDRSNQLKGWVESWTGNSKLEWLSPEGWFTRGHNLVEDVFERNVDGISIPTYKKGEFVWTPAPAAAEACLEELRKARHKHQDSSHIILIPRLMAPFWRRHLNKVCDFVFELPLGKLTVWKEDMFEPLTIGLVLPYLSHRPWQLKQSPVLVGLQKQLRKVWESDPVSSGPILRQLWDLSGHLGSMSEELALRVLRSFELPEIPHRASRKRRKRKSLGSEGRSEEVSGSKKRRQS